MSKPSYTVKHEPTNQLKLILTRDPRAVGLGNALRTPPVAVNKLQSKKKASPTSPVKTSPKHKPHSSEHCTFILPPAKIPIAPISPGTSGNKILFLASTKGSPPSSINKPHAVTSKTAHNLPSATLVSQLPAAMIKPATIKAHKSINKNVVVSEIPSSSKSVAASLGDRPVAKKKQLQPVLPLARARTIMKTHVKTLNLSQESVVVATKSAELLIGFLAKQACSVAREKANKDITYNHLAMAVRKNPDKLKFLYDILPEKVLARDFLNSR